MKNNRCVHVVVDVLYDFIDGSLPCNNTIEAIDKSVEYINAHPEQKVVYVCDYHPANHSSFKVNGGLWPAHCVQGTKGCKIHEKYYSLKNVESRPDDANIFYKGSDAAVEQYSGYEAVDKNGQHLSELFRGSDIIVSGIAIEYCVKNTVLDFINNGYNVSMLEEGVAYIESSGRVKAMEDIKRSGAKII